MEKADIGMGIKAGVLPNDGWQQQGAVQHVMAVDKANPRIEIEITEVDA